MLIVKNSQRYFLQSQSWPMIRLALSMIRVADSYLRKECGLSHAQFKLLVILQKFPGITQNDLAKSAHLTPAAVSRIVNILAEKKFIHRKVNPSNHRENIMVVSELGLKQFQQAVEVLNGIEKKLYNSFSTEKLKKWNDVTEEILAKLEKMFGECFC